MVALSQKEFLSSLGKTTYFIDPKVNLQYHLCEELNTKINGFKKLIINVKRGIGNSTAKWGLVRDEEMKAVRRRQQGRSQH